MRVASGTLVRSWGGVLVLGALLQLVPGAQGRAQETGPVVSYAGALDQDGCPDCCRFECRLTPTPTPEFDGLGRRVFQRQTGRFLLIVEGAPGLSLRPPSVGGTRDGNDIESLAGFPRPGLQVLFDRDLGDGSLIKECGTSAEGGVPSMIGLDESQTTDAMIETACRFEWLPDSAPCTRDRAGGFSTLGEDTDTQYCFQVTQPAEFPPGETVVQIQIMDTEGNLGPPEEIVVRVGTPGPTATPTPTVAGDLRISGFLAHYSGGGALAGAEVESSVGPSAVSDGAGAFSLHDLPAATVEIAPRKDGDVAGAITALDAAFVLQATVGARSLSDSQELACDVTGDGSVSSLDAAEILKLQVGLIEELPVTGAALCDSDWAFVPLPSSAPNQTVSNPSIGGGQCDPGRILYDPLVQDATGQSFFAVPFGDCTGNWQAGGGAATSAASPLAGRLGRVRRSRSGLVKVPLYLAGGEPLRGATIEVAYDRRRLRAAGIRWSPALGNALVIESWADPGLVRLAIASATSIESGGRPIAVLKFRTVRGSRLASRPVVEFVAAAVDEAR